LPTSHTDHQQEAHIASFRSRITGLELLAVGSLREVWRAMGSASLFAACNTGFVSSLCYPSSMAAQYLDRTGTML
jgi:hypothetical protein